MKGGSYNLSPLGTVRPQKGLGSRPDAMPFLPESQELQNPLPQLSAQLSALLKAGTGGNSSVPAGSSNVKNETVVIVEEIPPVHSQKYWACIGLLPESG